MIYSIVIPIILTTIKYARNQLNSTSLQPNRTLVNIYITYISPVNKCQKLARQYFLNKTINIFDIG